jgi:hypothetical protein
LHGVSVIHSLNTEYILQQFAGSYKNATFSSSGFREEIQMMVLEIEIRYISLCPVGFLYTIKKYQFIYPPGLVEVGFLA